MTDQLHDLAAPYVLDALDDLERVRFERHLAMCDECRAEVRDLSDGAAAIARDDAVPAPESLRAAVLADVVATPQAGEAPQPAAPAPGGMGRWLALAAAAAAVILVAIAAVSFWGGDESAFDRIAGAPDAVVVDLAATDAYPVEPPAVARVAFSPETAEAAVEFSGLEGVTGGFTYEAWLIAGDVASPAGLFTPDDGSVDTRLEGTPAPGTLVGITIEPEGGSAEPTGEVLFLGEL